MAHSLCYRTIEYCIEFFALKSKIKILAAIVTSIMYQENSILQFSANFRKFYFALVEISFI